MEARRESKRAKKKKKKKKEEEEEEEEEVQLVPAYRSPWKLVRVHTFVAVSGGVSAAASRHIPPRFTGPTMTGDVL
jgi:hypothetical protein